MAPKRKLKIPARAMARGSRLWSREYVEGVAENFAACDPDFMRLFMDFCYGGLYDRNVISQKTRELCAISALVVTNALPMVRTHIQAAWNCGATKREIMEVILQMYTYCGAPYVAMAARTAQEVFPALKRGKKADALPQGVRPARKAPARKTAARKAGKRAGRAPRAARSPRAMRRER